MEETTYVNVDTTVVGFTEINVPVYVVVAVT